MCAGYYALIEPLNVIVCDIVSMYNNRGCHIIYCNSLNQSQHPFGVSPILNVLLPRAIVIC